MKVREMTVTAHVERTINTGNYQNVKLMGGGSYTIDLEEGDEYQVIFVNTQNELMDFARDQVKYQEKLIRQKMQGD